MIGSKDEAKAILSCRRYGTDGDKWRIPAGWEFLGAGQFRAAFLSPSGVVYKIETRRNSRQSNRGEYERILEIRAGLVGSDDAIIPKSWLYTVGKSDVIAMEFFSGERLNHYCDTECHCEESDYPECICECFCAGEFGPECAWQQLNRIELDLGLTDLHDENVIFIPAQGKFAVIDLGA